MGMYGWHDNDLHADDLTVDGTLTFGDAATDNLIIKGRASSMTKAGAAIQVASLYEYGEGIEMKYQVTDWTKVGSSFKGMYLRAEAATNSAAGKSIYGAEIYGVCNNVTMTTGNLWGTMNYAYVKGVGAVTVNNMYAVQGELTWDASRTGDCTITTAAACFRAKITGGRVADYTKIHGYELTIGEMDGDSAKFGSGILMQDDSEMGGTCTLTTGLNITIGCTTSISITGSATDAIKIATGTFTDGLDISGVSDSAIRITGTPSYGINMAAATTAISISGTTTTAISITGATTTGISVGTSGSKLSIATNTARLISSYSTSALTTGAINTLTISQTMTALSTSNQIEVAQFILTSNVKTGTWANAILGKIDYSADGLAHGIAGVICSELDLPSTTAVVRGTYCAWETEINCPTGCNMGGNPIYVNRIAVWGGAETQFDAVGYMWEITGVTSGATSFWYKPGSPIAAKAIDEFIRVKTPNGVRYLALYDDVAAD